MYNERRLYIGGGPGVMPAANYGPIGSSNPTPDRRGGRGKGNYLYKYFHVVHYLCTRDAIL